tara:strand:- start:199 stop:411 length:213 start_codon:yes stop_codon:yes gene_type:complete
LREEFDGDVMEKTVEEKIFGMKMARRKLDKCCLEVFYSGESEGLINQGWVDALDFVGRLRKRVSLEEKGE